MGKSVELGFEFADYQGVGGSLTSDASGDIFYDNEKLEKFTLGNEVEYLLDITLYPVTTAVISGKVLDNEDKGLAGIIVSGTYKITGKSEGNIADFNTSITTDENGAFTILGLNKEATDYHLYF